MKCNCYNCKRSYFDSNTNEVRCGVDRHFVRNLALLGCGKWDSKYPKKQLLLFDDLEKGGGEE